MGELIKILTTYNIFNYLFPGTIFVYLLNKVTDINFIQDNLLIGAFFYYFIGMILSRIGSLIIEPFFKKIKIVKFSDYKLFVKYSKEDNKIELFSEINNMYRTFISLFFCLGLSYLFHFINSKIQISDCIIKVSLIAIILMIFIFSYIKQTGYINKRIDSNVNQNKK